MMLKGSSSRHGYHVTRQDSSSEESEGEEETFLGVSEEDPPEEEDPHEEESPQEPPDEPEEEPLGVYVTEPEPVSASIDNGAVSLSGVSVNIDMTAVHPGPSSASEDVEGPSEDVPLTTFHDSSSLQAPTAQTSYPCSVESDSEITEETAFRILPSSRVEVEEEVDRPDGEDVNVSPPSYSVVLKKFFAPPDYETATRDKDSREARSALQDTTTSTSPAEGGPPLELSVVAEDDERPTTREAWVGEEEEETGDVQNAANEDIEARQAEESVATVEDERVPNFIPDPLRPAFRQVRMFRPGVKTALITFINFFVALFLLLIILSIQKLDYTQMGFKMKRVGQFVYYMDEVFDAGRYFIGPSNIFKPYSAIAHSMEFQTVRIYTTDPLRISFRCHFHFFLKKTELGLLEEDLDRYYLETIEKASISAIKNSASQFSVDQYLTERARIEAFIHGSLQDALEGTCCVTKSQCRDYSSCHECYAASGTNCTRGIHMEVPFFNLLLVQLPDAILSRKQQILITALAGEEEVFHQTEVLTRKTTQKLVRDIRNEALFISANGTAHSKTIRAKANAEANALTNLANSRGLTNMFSNLSIVEEDHKASVHWLRTLRYHPNLISGVDFDEYLKLTRGIR